ncbi:hypothetical protein ACFQFH_08920 [Halobaculum halobium]|uniref:Major facilitator superfamily (MFS) profile domain-containing protein n=1 Tax=Halobaculum halobium TaxID=3032281 RepID=A0ABD5T9T2_9EURY|nr:hypothetical protein [Halobaculum sp. SYNS20]
MPVALAAGVPVGAGFSVSLTLYRSAITGLAGDDTRGGLVSLGESIGRLGSTGAPVAMGAAVAFVAEGAGYAAALRTVSVAVAVGVVAVGGGLLLVGDLEADTGAGAAATAADE